MFVGSLCPEIEKNILLCQYHYLVLRFSEREFKYITFQVFYIFMCCVDYFRQFFAVNDFFVYPHFHGIGIKLK